MTIALALLVCLPGVVQAQPGESNGGTEAESDSGSESGGESRDATDTDTDTATESAGATDTDTATDSDTATESAGATDTDTATESAGATDTDTEPAPEPDDRTYDERVYGVGTGSPVLATFGSLTILGLVVSVGGVAGVLERTGSVDLCESAEADDDPPVRGCVNLSAIREERDIAIGILVGGGTLALGAGLVWMIAALTEGDDDDSEARVSCAPGVLSFECRGAF